MWRFPPGPNPHRYPRRQAISVLLPSIESTAYPLQQEQTPTEPAEAWNPQPSDHAVFGASSKSFSPRSHAAGKTHVLSARCYYIPE